ncbi:hypothetical protein ACFLYP_00860 [Chloroflexota bacterium]
MMETIRKIRPWKWILISIALGIAVALMPWARVSYQEQTNFSAELSYSLLSGLQPNTETPEKLAQLEFGENETRYSVFLFSTFQPYGDRCDRWHFLWADSGDQNTMGGLIAFGIGALVLNLNLWITSVILHRKTFFKKISVLAGTAVLTLGCVITTILITLFGQRIACDYFDGIPYSRVLNLTPFWPTILLAVLSTLAAAIPIWQKFPARKTGPQI